MRTDFNKHVVANAAEIGMEVGCAAGDELNTLALLDDVITAAKALALIENAADFDWEDSSSKDWESTCAMIAECIVKAEIPTSWDSSLRIFIRPETKVAP